MSVRRTVIFSKEVDHALSAYLGQREMQKDDLSKFVENAVVESLVRRVLGEQGVSGSEARVLLEKVVEYLDDGEFEAAVRHIKARATNLSEDEVMSLVDEARGHA